MNIDAALDIWSGGQLMAFSGLDGSTSFETGLVARTCSEGPFLEIKLPGILRVKLPEIEKCRLAGDFMILETAKGTLKAAFSDAFNLVIEGSCEVEDVPAELEVERRGARTLISTKGHADLKAFSRPVDEVIKARRAWLESLQVESGKANASLVKALSQLKTQVYSPEGRMKRRWTTPDRWPHRRIWLWDSAFHAIGLRHVDPQLAKDAVEAIFDVQAPDGFIPHMASPSKSSEITQPPVLAFAVGLVNEKLKDRAWLASLYPKLKAYLEWDMRHRDRDGAGLLEWFIENSPTCRSGESGADNSTRFDRASNLDAPDFNAYLAQDFETMASFAAELGMAADVKLWRERLAKINGLMNERLWDDALGLYMDFDNDAGRQSDVMSFAAFLPLLCGAASQSQAAKLVAHLKNPDTFGTPLPIPTIAKCQSQYYSKDMWRGPVWININWLVARGLRRYGYAAEAAELLRKTVAEIELMRERYGTFFEFYDDQRVDDPPKLLRKGSNDPANPYHQVLRDYGWSASLYVEMLLA